MNTPKQFKMHGFTLLELLIAIAVLGIFLGLAVPSFLSALQNSRISAQSNDLLTAFQLARSEALKRKVPVSVCAADTTAANPTCGSDWTAGWIVIVDDSGVGGASATYADYDDDVLRVWQPIQSDLTIGGADADNFVRYLPNGQIDLASGATAPAYQMRIADCTGSNQRNISVSRTGRANVERVECS